MDRIELIELLKTLLEPMPLRDGCFEQSGRRVGVVFEQL